MGADGFRNTPHEPTAKDYEGPSRDLHELTHSLTPRKFSAGSYVFHEGERAEGLHVIQSGLVKLEVSSVKGSAHTLQITGSGGILGLRSLFSGEPYPKSAIAVSESVIYFLPEKDLRNLFSEKPSLAFNLLNLVSKDLRRAEEKWLHQMDKDASQRIGEALLFLNDHFPDQVWTRRDIAQWAGTTPETVIRTLAKFAEAGWIDQSEGKQIKILKRERLQP